MSVREPFKVEENLVAAVAGLGILLAIIAGLITGFGTVDSDIVDLLLFAGLGMVAVGMGLWLALLRPWEQFDDLVTPYYTGHHDDHHDDHHDEEALAGGGADEIGIIEAIAVAPHAEAEPVVEAATPAEPVLATTATVEPVVTPVVEVAEPVIEDIVEDDVPIEPVLDAGDVLEEDPIADPEPVAEIEVIEDEPEPVAEVEVIEEDPDREDDLRIIEGIGPKTADALKASGIKTFAALAAQDPAEVERLVKEEHGVRIVGSTATWRKQAELAASGDFAALEDLKGRIKSGYLYDDLTRIEGIGDKTKEALYDAKIRSYDELALASVEDIEAALDKAGVSSSRHIDTWAKQAQFIVDGDLNGLAAFQEELK